MIKMIEVIYRKPELTHEQFIDYWYNHHAPLISRIIPGLKRYVQCHPVQIGKGEPPCDGFAELWWDNIDEWRKSAEWLKATGGKELLDDAKNFADRTRLIACITEEKEIPVHGPALK